MRPRIVLLMFVVVASIATSPSARAQTTSDVPSGTLAFFSQETTTCPDGWTVAEEAQGSLLLATTSADAAGTGNGQQPLGDREDRMHGHCFEAGIKVDHKNMEGASGGSNAVGEAGTYFLQGNTGKATSGLAFAQLLLCVRE